MICFLHWNSKTAAVISVTSKGLFAKKNLKCKKKHSCNRTARWVR